MLWDFFCGDKKLTFKMIFYSLALTISSLMRLKRDLFNHILF